MCGEHCTCIFISSCLLNISLGKILISATCILENLFAKRQFDSGSLDEWHVLGHVLPGNVLRELPHEVGEDGLVVGDVLTHLKLDDSGEKLDI